ncbi:MAG: diacylglycerol/lipid kinase family protein [Candidatus Dormibacterales bacterium]
MSRVLIIVNPAAGGGRAGRRWEALSEALRASGLAFDAALTSRPGEATEMARREVERSRPLVVAAGGDGTLNEVVNGFFEGEAPIPTGSALGMIPLGSGGDFKRTFGLPADPDGIAALFSAGEARPVDVGRAWFQREAAGRGLRHFINVADAGIGGKVVATVNRSRKPLGGRVAFVAASLSALASWRNVPMRVTAGGAVRELVAQQVVIANGRYYGGGMKVAPRADPRDGMFDVVLVGDLNLRENLRGLVQIRSGHHLDGGNPKVEHLLAARVEVEADAPVRVDLDGEGPGALPAGFEVLPGAIRLLAPPGVGRHP